MKENNTESEKQIHEEDINKNDIIQNENSQNESNIVANTSNNNNVNNINEVNNNSEIVQNSEINNNNNEDNNNNINQIITNENFGEINDNANNDQNNSEDEDNTEKKFNPMFTFSFKLFFILNSLSYYYITYKSNKIKNFSLCLWPINNKKQSYRIITCHFCYKGFLDYFLSMLGLFYITKYLEREIGSIYLIIIAFYGMILICVLYLGFFRIIKYLFNAISLYFIEQGSFSGVDFCLFLSYFLLKKNKSRNVNLNSFDLKGIYLVYLIILLIQFLSPSALLFLNIGGTISAVLIFKSSKSNIFPKNDWIIDMEKLFGLDNNKNIVKIILGYYSLTDNEKIIENVKEFDGSLEDL